MRPVDTDIAAIAAIIDRQLFESILDGVLILDGQGYIVNMNPAGCRQLGFSRDELVGMHITCLDTPEYAAKVSERLQLIDTHGSAVFETAHVRKDGSVLPVEIHSTLLDIHNRKFYLSVIRDISRRKEMESSLLAVQDELNSTLNAIPDLLFELGLDGRYHSFRVPHAGLLAAPQDALVGRSVSEVLPPDAAASCMEALREADEKGYSIGHQFQLALGGDAKWFELSVARKKGTYPGEPRFVVLSRDITERKQAAAALLEKESQYRIALETATDGFWMIDLQGRLLEVNHAYERLSGYRRDELLRMRIPDLDADDDHETMARRIQQIIREGGSARFERQHRRKDGSVWPVRVVTTYAPIAGGRFFVFLTDLTEQKSVEASLQLAAMVYDNSSEAMLVTDADNHIMAVNKAFESMTGYSAHEVLGKSPGMFKSGRHDRSFCQAMWHALTTEGCWHGEVWDKRKDGQEHAKLLTINAIKDDVGTTYRYVALFTDITERKQFEELIWRQANFDALTRLPNRQMFHDRLQHEAKKSHRSGRPMALLVIDLDRFKEVNDALGHHKGDLLLIDAAARLGQCVRDSDTVARLGGDEFTVILSEMDDMTGIDRIAQDIIGKLATVFQLEGEQAFISASIGISLYPDDTTDLDVLFKNADQAMYVAKSTGRNRFSYFTPDLQDAAQKRLRLANDLRAALASDQFLLHYQPIVEMSTGQIHKAEALIRWQHPERGMVSPMDFIPMAEETGLIVPIGDWVFKEAVRQVKRWRSRYRPSFQVSVNKSPVQIHHHAGCHAAWPEYLKEQGLPGQSVTIEITEGLLLHAEANINQKLLDFRDAGIQVAIDDFGTGYSSLSCLKEFDIDFLKIDQSFVRNLGSGGSDLALCEAIIVMAHKLGFKVIAEGVETRQQHDPAARFRMRLRPRLSLFPAASRRRVRAVAGEPAALSILIALCLVLLPGIAGWAGVMALQP